MPVSVWKHFPGRFCPSRKNVLNNIEYSIRRPGLLTAKFCYESPPLKFSETPVTASIFLPNDGHFPFLFCHRFAFTVKKFRRKLFQLGFHFFMQPYSCNNIWIAQHSFSVCHCCHWNRKNVFNSLQDWPLKKFLQLWYASWFSSFE